MPAKDFAVELIKAIEEISAAHANGALNLASGAHIDFLFGTPYHAVAQDRGGMDALDAILQAALGGEEFKFDSEATVDRDKATINLSSLRLVSRIKSLASPGKPSPPVQKLGQKAQAKPAAKAPSLDLALAQDKLPILPEGGEFPHDQKSIPAILFHLSSGVIDATSPLLRGLVVVVDGRLVDAIAVVQDQVLEGPSALDAITADAAASLNVRTLPSNIASVIPFYWKLPVRVKDLHARWVGGAQAVQNFIKPDAWGVLHVRADDDTALIYFSQGQVLLSYSQQHPSPSTDLSALQSLLNAASAVISARVEDEVAPAVLPAGPAPLATPSAPVPAMPPATPAPVPAPEPVAPPEPAPVTPEVAVVQPAVASPALVAEAAVPEPASQPAPIPLVAPDATVSEPAAEQVSPMTPSPAVPTPAPAAAEANAVAPSAAVAPAEAPALQPPWATSVPEPQLDGSVRDRIIAMIRNDLKFHSPAIEAEFLGAELTRTGLLKAAKKVRGMRPRLISEDRMESIGTRAINIITGREAA